MGIYFGHSIDSLARNIATLFTVRLYWSDLYMSSDREFGKVEKNFVWASEMEVLGMMSWPTIESDTSRITSPCGIVSLIAKCGSRDQRQKI